MAKKIWQSKTVWIAILQAIAGVMAVVFAENPGLVTIGWVGVVKSVVDVAVRLFLTSTAVRL